MDPAHIPLGDSPDPLAHARAAWGGTIPGLPGVAAFRVLAADPSPIPIVLAVPHAGRAYPDALLAAMRTPQQATLRLEDRLVDQLGRAVAAATGASLLIADAPRAMIDLNRAADDLDWDMLSDSPPGVSLRPGHAGHRSRSGLGLVPRRLPGLGDLWRRRLPHAELVARLEGVHQPYHARLAMLVEQVRAQWGAVLLIDLHSMPPLPAHGGAAAQFVVGDRFGTACDGSLVASAFAELAAARRLAAHNRPYAGGYVLERHARRTEGVHAIQLEIDRSAYLDRALVEPGPGFDSMVAVLVGLVRRLAGDVAEIGRERLRWRTAAE